MVHTFEVLVDIKEYADQANSAYQCGTSRYEISAESIEKADGMARVQARTEHPKGTEYDVRVTRLLK
ncbi:hypothetical protein ACX27_21485 [Nostoc piscinale CENA21]|uniref:Uncharacterized protein n=1 Tax=Nostoc piscinale CENA21 TaxID=224013 RepID=A0A0M4T4D8_9NOSO|nr:hypothetical protein [Nostoc piscinale]ALF54820.1 hypothetical protein ACX27_21485 [Nostoc piscinale CENA21]